jgi:hybrid cluster-associated redox disulfide protein
MKITKDTIIGEVISKRPELIEHFFKEGVFCVGCGAANFETIEQGLMGHGKSKEEINNFIKKLNKK